MSYHEAMERYGIDKPDTRFGLELSATSPRSPRPAASRSSPARWRTAAACAASSCRAAPSSAARRSTSSRSVAKEYGAKGLAWLKLNPRTAFQGPVGEVPAGGRDARDDGEGRRRRGRPRCSFVADRNSVVFAALAQRAPDALGRQLELIDDNSKLDALWVMDFPLFEYDEDEKQWFAMHHMFTMPQDRPPRSADDVELGPA